MDSIFRQHPATSPTIVDTSYNSNVVVNKDIVVANDECKLEFAIGDSVILSDYARTMYKAFFGMSNAMKAMLWGYAARVTKIDSTRIYCSLAGCDIVFASSEIQKGVGFEYYFSIEPLKNGDVVCFNKKALDFLYKDDVKGLKTNIDRKFTVVECNGIITKVTLSNRSYDHMIVVTDMLVKCDGDKPNKNDEELKIATGYVPLNDYNISDVSVSTDEESCRITPIVREQGEKTMMKIKKTATRVKIATIEGVKMGAAQGAARTIIHIVRDYAGDAYPTILDSKIGKKAEPIVLAVAIMSICDIFEEQIPQCDNLRHNCERIITKEVADNTDGIVEQLLPLMKKLAVSVPDLTKELKSE